MAKAKSPIKKPAKALTDALAGESRARRRNLAGRVALEAAADATQRNDLLPAIEIVRRPIASLTAPARNVRKVSPEHIAEIAASIRSFGMTSPVLTNRSGEILDGVVTVEAARLLGIEELPCIEIDHLTPDEQKRLRIALNRLGERGSFDLPVLRMEIEDMLSTDEVITIPGLEAEEIDAILESDAATFDERANAQVEPDRTRPAVVEPGDLFEIGSHRLFCGDARDPESYERLFRNAPKARVLPTDMPYGCAIDGFVGGKGRIHHREFVDGTSDLDEEGLEALVLGFLSAALPYLLPGGLIFTFMNWHGIETLLRTGRTLGLRLLNLLVWDKGRGGMGGMYRNAHELIALFKHGEAPHLDRVKLGRHGRDRTNVMDYPGATTLGSSARKALETHPTPKSVELIADLLLDSTERGDIVLDPFAGSGTIYIAAEKTRRVAFGMELDPIYCDAILRRLEHYTGRSAVHVESGKSFMELASSRREAVTRPEDSIDTSTGEAAPEGVVF